jgi:dolichol-phosphate mannosyltransferase
VIVPAFRRLTSFRLVRFGAVGLTGVVVNLLVLRLLYGELHWLPVLASALAAEASIVNNFLWNNWWTFGERTIQPVRFVRFNAAALGGLAITAGIFAVLLGRFGLPYLVAELVGIGAATAWNFAVSIFWTWA